MIEGFGSIQGAAMCRLVGMEWREEGQGIVLQGEEDLTAVLNKQQLKNTGRSGNK